MATVQGENPIPDAPYVYAVFGTSEHPEWARPGWWWKPRKGEWIEMLSPNAVMEYRGSGQAKRRCQAKDIEGMYQAVQRGTRWPAEPLRRAHVHFQMHFKVHRKRDAPNMLANLKGTLDGLVEAGIIADDNIEVVGTPTISCVCDTDQELGVVVFVSPVA